MTPNPKTLTQDDPSKQPVVSEGTDTDPGTGEKAKTDLPPPNGKDKAHPRPA